MAKLELDKIVKFEELLHAFTLVERVAHIKDRAARENDAEHSFIMPMMAWYIVEAFDLPLDSALVMRYAIVHDIVEVYAGDSYILDVEARKTKHDREEKARVRIAVEFPEFGALHETIVAYERQEDPESKFVKALDKVEPVIANFMQSGRTWKEMKVSIDLLKTHKRERVTESPEIAALLEDIIAAIEPRQSEFFDN